MRPSTFLIVPRRQLRPQVNRRDRQRRVVQEPTDVLDRLAGVAAELCGRVPEDVDARALHPREPEVAVETAARVAAACGPQRWIRRYVRDVVPEGQQRRRERDVGGLRQLALAELPTLAAVGVPTFPSSCVRPLAVTTVAQRTVDRLVCNRGYVL